MYISNMNINKSLMKSRLINYYVEAICDFLFYIIFGLYFDRKMKERRGKSRVDTIQCGN